MTDTMVYTAQDIDKVEAIKRWLDERGESRAWLARKAGMNSSTLSTVLNLKYPSSPSEHLNKMMQVIEVETERRGDGTPGYVEGSVHKLAFVVCDRTRKHANFGVLCGNVGVGKTHTFKEYANRKPQTLLIESNPNMTAGSLMAELLKQLKANVTGGINTRFDEVVKALQGTNHLLIVDEAENMSAPALEYIRRIRDKAQIGVVLVGTSKLHMLIKPEQGQFDQIRSRVSMWPATIQTISRDDADEMARVALADWGDVPDPVLDALWAFCGGSARVLHESLFSGLKDYAQNKTLTPQLIKELATKVLNLKERNMACA